MTTPRTYWREEDLRERADLIASYDDGASYEWSIMHIWRRKEDGALFMYDSSGCSCDGPYALDVRSWDDLQPITNVQQVVRTLDDKRGGGVGPKASEIVEILRQVQSALVQAAAL